jgi:hypothetical protein
MKPSWREDLGFIIQEDSIMSLPEAIRGINFFGEIKITGCT